MKRRLVKIGVACVGMEQGTIILTRFLLWSDIRLFFDWKSKRQNHKKTTKSIYY